TTASASETRRGASGDGRHLMLHRWSWPSSSVHHFLLWLLRLRHLNRGLELQRTAYIWPLPTFQLTLNKRRLPPCPLHLHGITALQADEELRRSAQLHDVILPSSNRDTPLLWIHILDGP